MIQQMLPVLVNCSRLLPLEVTASHVSEKMHRIQYSGCNPRIRYKVLSSALKAYERITIGAISTGRGQREANKNQGLAEKREKRNGKEWDCKGQYQ